MALLDLPGLVLPGKRRYIRIFELYVEHNLPFGDAYIAAEMERHGAAEIYSFDKEFSRLPGVTRLEPEE
jgi:predicted nucleic acid-binding protein